MEPQLQDLLFTLATVMRASKHCIEGRLARDPEAKYFESGSCVVKARIAVNRPGAKRDDGMEPDWFTVEIWGAEGQRLADEAHKADLIEVMGRVRTNRWTDQQGQPKTDLVITATSWTMVRPATAAGTAAASAAQPAPAPAAPAAPAPAPATAPAATAWVDPPF